MMERDGIATINFPIQKGEEWKPHSNWCSKTILKTNLKTWKSAKYSKLNSSSALWEKLHSQVFSNNY